MRNVDILTTAVRQILLAGIPILKWSNIDLHQDNLSRKG